MVIRGKTRGNGRQLADYLLKKADNDNIRVLGIRGTSQPDSLKYSLIEMSLTSELTKSGKGLYHAQINPAYGEDRRMTMDDWLKAADILEAEAGFAGQKRVIVLHEKKGRLHAHVVWERFDHDTGRMKSDSFNRLAQDRARKEMEHVFEHAPTPERNTNRPDMKKHLSELWQSTKAGAEFISAAEECGYTICKGTQRPFMVCDATGRTFDLARQLDSVRTTAIRLRFNGIELIPEKQAIHEVRIRRNAVALDTVQEAASGKIKQQKQKTRFAEVLTAMKEEGKIVTTDKSKATQTAQAFLENKIDDKSQVTEAERKRKLKEFKEQFLQDLKEKTRSSDYEPER